MERENEIIANQNEIIGLLTRQVNALRDQNELLERQVRILVEEKHDLLCATRDIYNCFNEMRQDLARQSRNQYNALHNIDRNLVIFARHMTQQDKSNQTEKSNSTENTLEQ